MKQVLALFAIMFILAIGTFIAQRYLQTGDFSAFFGAPPKKTPTATINNHAFNLEIAKTPEEKEIGLSTKESLDQDSGIYFPFEKPSYYRFWMRDMKFPIDIIFIRNGRIVTIHKNVNPPTNPNETLPIYSPTEPADAVLEINAGLSDEYNFKVGDVVILKDT